MKFIKSLSIAGMVFGVLSFNAAAINLTPDDAFTSGSIPKNPKADDIEAITGFADDLSLLYKAEVGNADDPTTLEEGSFAGSYSTTFDNEPLDPQDATITYTGGESISGDPIYLLVKDGASDPIWYLFDLSSTALNWNGTDPINLTGFWPQKGAISQVSIFGVADSGTTLALLGFGLISLSYLRRKLAV